MVRQQYRRPSRVQEEAFPAEGFNFFSKLWPVHTTRLKLAFRQVCQSWVEHQRPQGTCLAAIADSSSFKVVWRFLFLHVRIILILHRCPCRLSKYFPWRPVEMCLSIVRCLMRFVILIRRMKVLLCFLPVCKTENNCNIFSRFIFFSRFVVIFQWKDYGRPEWASIAPTQGVPIEHNGKRSLFLLSEWGELVELHYTEADQRWEWINHEKPGQSAKSEWFQWLMEIWSRQRFKYRIIAIRRCPNYRASRRTNKQAFYLHGCFGWCSVRTILGRQVLGLDLTWHSIWLVVSSSIFFFAFWTWAHNAIYDVQVCGQSQPVL